MEDSSRGGDEGRRGRYSVARVGFGNGAKTCRRAARSRVRRLAGTGSLGKAKAIAKKRIF